MTDEKKNQSNPSTDAQDASKDAEVKEAVEEAKEAATEAAESAEKAEEVAEKVEEVVEKVEEKVEEVKEEIKEDPSKAQGGAAAPKPAPSGKFKDLIEKIEGLTALELSELVKALEERFGVSAAAPVAVAGAAAPAAAAAEEEKTHWTVVLANGGANKIGAIKAVREVLPDLGLVEAKEMVEGAPKTLKENVPTEEANSIKAKLEEAGAAVELK